VLILVIGQRSPQRRSRAQFWICDCLRVTDVVDKLDEPMMQVKRFG
jgi:hypothetical protein